MRWFGRKRREQELERELQCHLDLEAEERAEDGLSPEEARYAARRAFGSATLAKEDTRDAWGWTSMERLVQDVRCALRLLGRSPGFVRDSHVLRVFARLKPGVSLTQAQQEMSVLAAQLAREYPRTNAGLGAAVVDLRDQLVGNLRVAPTDTWVLVGSALVLLLVGAAASYAPAHRAATIDPMVALRHE